MKMLNCSPHRMAVKIFSQFPESIKIYQNLLHCEAIKKKNKPIEKIFYSINENLIRILLYKWKY